MKKILKYLTLILFVVSLDVYAANANSAVGNNLNEYSCTAFQDSNMVVTGDAYFGRCMQARCNGSKWELRYYSTDSVSCSNGNINPYMSITKTGCDAYQNNSCSGNAVKFCTTVTYFDCNRTTNGSAYTTTTKAPKPKTTKKPTTTTPPVTEPPVTEAPKNNNTYLSSLSLSNGTIEFNKDVTEYSIDVETTISSINVDAVPEASTSTVKVDGNTNLVEGTNTITITVTAEDGSTGNYVIHVNKKEVLSNNARLASITIEGYDLKFDSETYNYTLKVKKTESLNIEATTEDSNAIYMIEGNSGLKNNSVIRLVVTAADGKTTQDYTITVKFSGKGGAAITIIFILILLGALGGGAYYFFNKKRNSGEKEYEYE